MTHISLNVNLLFEAKSLLNTSLLYGFILHLVVSILSLETGLKKCNYSLCSKFLIVGVLEGGFIVA